MPQIRFKDKSYSYDMLRKHGLDVKTIATTTSSSNEKKKVQKEEMGVHISAQRRQPRQHQTTNLKIVTNENHKRSDVKERTVVEPVFIYEVQPNNAYSQIVNLPGRHRLNLLPLLRNSYDV